MNRQLAENIVASIWKEVPPHDDRSRELAIRLEAKILGEFKQEDEIERALKIIERGGMDEPI